MSREIKTFCFVKASSLPLTMPMDVAIVRVGCCTARFLGRNEMATGPVCDLTLEASGRGEVESVFLDFGIESQLQSQLIGARMVCTERPYPEQKQHNKACQAKDQTHHAFRSINMAHPRDRDVYEAPGRIHQTENGQECLQPAHEH